MAKLKEIVIATKNKGKVAEFSYLLGSYFDQIHSLLDFESTPEIVEDGVSFEENAIKKAVITSTFFNKITIADDSGLVVESLNGEPGIHSARYAGDDSSDEKNVNKLLNKIRPVKEREAKFVCVIVFTYPSGINKLFKGVCHGLIIDEKRGSNGFGYDPVFYLPKIKKTMAELDLNYKNKISHRAKAVQKLIDYLKYLPDIERN